MAENKKIGAGFDYPSIPEGISDESLLQQLQLLMPISIEGKYYVRGDDRATLVMMDEVNGFCKPGCGNLAPREVDPAIESVIEVSNSLAKKFFAAGKRIIAFRDCHKGIERPYLLHCQEGTEETELVEQLQWLGNGIRQMGDQVFIMPKSCTNVWIGRETITDNRGVTQLSNDLLFILSSTRTKIVVVVGLCTDICDMQLVHSLMSAINCGLLPDLEHVVVCVPGCTTYDLPLDVCRQLNLPASSAHPRGPAHHIGLYQMQQAGAILAKEVLLY